MGGRPSLGFGHFLGDRSAGHLVGMAWEFYREL